MPSGNLLYLNNPFEVLTITYLVDSSSKQSCWWAWLISSLVNYRTPASLENKSSIFGIGYLSRGEALFMVCLKSQTFISFITGTIGAAHYACCTGDKIPWATNLSSSASTETWRNDGSTKILLWNFSTCPLTIWKLDFLQFVRINVMNSSRWVVPASCNP